MRVHKDGRRTAYCDVFKWTAGDVNVFLLSPGKPSGWHRHALQIDQLFVAVGEVTIGLQSELGGKPEYRVLRDGESIMIAPLLWHGYEASNEAAVVVMYLSHPYGDGWDEQKRSFDEVPWDPPLPPLVDDEWNKGQDPDPDDTA